MRLRGLLIAALFAGCASTMQTSPDATAELRNTRGEVVGVAGLSETRDGVRVMVRAQGLPPGPHGVHIHAAGRCDGADFASAAGHFNPTDRRHGLGNPAGPHAGDLPNLDIGPDGRGRLLYVTKLVTLAPGPASLFGPQGAAIVVHAAADDGMTDPAGNSGARIACGVVTRAAPTEARDSGVVQGGGGGY